VADLVRRSVDHFIRRTDRPTRCEITKRGKAMARVLPGGPSDLADRHDRYLTDDQTE
jgi:hypothetical protein